jgi:hypothetical protein
MWRFYNIAGYTPGESLLSDWFLLGLATIGIVMCVGAIIFFQRRNK